jgi:hypothetical protein
MHGRLVLALLALSLLLPATAQAAAPGQDIRKVEAYASSAGALVRVTLRAPLRGRIAVSFRPRPGIKGNSRPAARIIRGRRADFVFRGDARNLARVTVRTRGDRMARRISHAEDCTALTRLARKLRPLRRGRPAVRARLRAIADRRAICGGGTAVPIDQPAPPAPAPGPGFTPPAARFALSDGLTPEDPLRAGAAVGFTDASQGTDLVDWRWNFGDGVPASGRSVQHAFAQPGRYTVLLTVENARGQTSAFGQEVFVRGPGAATFDAPAIACPGPGETLPVTVTRVVPSWARFPAQVAYEIPAGPCSADVSDARDLEITPGNTLGQKDAWGRTAATLRFTFDLSDGTGTGTVTPEVTVSWS